MYKAAPDEQVRYAYVDSAIIAQNIYLFCAANGLGTCLVGGVNAKETIAALAFKDNMLLTYVQPIGYPKS
jgi:nitroreductase